MFVYILRYTSILNYKNNTSVFMLPLPICNLIISSSMIERHLERQFESGFLRLKLLWGFILPCWLLDHFPLFLKVVVTCWCKSENKYSSLSSSFSFVCTESLLTFTYQTSHPSALTPSQAWWWFKLLNERTFTILQEVGIYSFST